MRTFERLGTGKPHVSDELDGESVAVPRSGTPAASRAEETMGAEGSENGDSVTNKQLDAITPKTTESPAAGTPTPAAEKPPRRSTSKKGRPRKAAESRPYEGLFEASLKLDDGPTTWQITDLRANVWGGDRTWNERAQCLICGAKVD